MHACHLLEEDPATGVPTPVREANEQLVQLFYLSAEACGPLPAELGGDGGEAEAAAEAAAVGETPPAEEAAGRIEELHLGPSAEVDEDLD